MAAKLFHRKSNPGELVNKVHQAFVRLPYESSQDKIMDDIARLVAGIKVCLHLWCGSSDVLLPLSFIVPCVLSLSVSLSLSLTHTHNTYSLPTS